MIYWRTLDRGLGPTLRGGGRRLQRCWHFSSKGVVTFMVAIVAKKDCVYTQLRV